MASTARPDAEFDREGGAAWDDEFEDAAPSRINFERIRSTLIRNRAVIVAALAACILAALAVTALMRPLYTAAASVQIDQQAAKVLGSEDSQQAMGLQDTERFLQTQLDVLRSRSLAERVASALRLDRDDTFLVQMGGKAAATPGMDTGAARHARVVGQLMGNMDASLAANSRIAIIRFVSPDPQVAATVANTFAQQFIVANLQRRFDATSYARNFLQGRLEELRRRLETSERQANVYARQAGLIDASNAATPAQTAGSAGASAPRSLTLARLVQLNGTLVTAQTARLEAEQRWAQTQRTPLMSLPEVLSNAAIQELRQQRAQLASAYEEEKQRRRDAYPTMIQEAARIAELDRQITRMALDVRRSISDAYQTALNQEREVARNVTALERDARTEQDRGVRFNVYRREVDTNRELYDGLLQRFKELSAEAGVTTNNISIVDTAQVPGQPTSPRLFLNLALGALLGLAAAATIVILRELFDDRVRLPDDVPAKLGLPLMGSIPGVGGDAAPAPELDNPKSEFAEAYQSVRATLELSTTRGVPRSLLLTSSRPSEGKSTSAYAIARAFAQQGRRVVLVDCDLRRPSLHKLLERENALGMSTVLSGQHEADTVLQDTDIPNLRFVGSGPIPPNPAQLLQADAVRRVFDALTARFDLVVVDAPPVLGLADTLELAAGVEGVLFVVEAGSMHFGGVRSSINRLRDVRANLLGVLLNKFDARAVGYSSNYAYNYTYRYRDAA